MSSERVTFRGLPSSRRVRAWRASLFGALAVLGVGCSELEARRHARAGNVYFQTGRYADAIREYELADELSPGVPEVSLNRGLACRELMLREGASSADRERAIECALAALSRLRQLRPEDPRGDRFYLQTLFDAQRFDMLIAIYETRLKEKPDDLASIDELIALYSSVDRWVPVLRWAVRRARIAGNDAEAQYVVGVMIYNYVHQKRRTKEASYDPGPDPNANDRGQLRQTPPAFAKTGAIASAKPRLAAVGIAYLARAIELRPEYREAMLIMDLLRRHEHYGPLDESRELELLGEELLLEPIEVPHRDPAGPDPGAEPAAPAPGTPA
jgi:tetratricopeptide (TPR) repeat protein